MEENIFVIGYTYEPGMPWETYQTYENDYYTPTYYPQYYTCPKCGGLSQHIIEKCHWCGWECETTEKDKLDKIIKLLEEIRDAL